jgi:hypothetical protein
MNFDEILKKAQEMKKSGTVDLSTDEDLSIAIMNLISLEEHFIFSHTKTGKDEYLEMMREVREMRKDLLGRMIPKHEGETWCVSKHLLAATMRLIEVGTKNYADGKVEDAKKVFAHANKVFGMFWALRLKLVSSKEVKTAVASEKPWTYEDIMNKLVDCCDE